MASARRLRLTTLVQRELQEYRLSLVWTPVVAAMIFVLLLLLGVVLGLRFSSFGGGILKSILSDGAIVHPAIVIQVDDEEEVRLPDVPVPPAPPAATRPDVDLKAETPAQAPPDEAWNFSGNWRFEPERREKKDYEKEVDGSLNPLLGMPHLVLMIVLVVVTVNYLLGSLYNDRKDRSILFWKSMPVSEWEEVLVRLGVALVVAPTIYIGVSIVLQLLLIALSMLAVAAFGADPWADVWADVHFSTLFLREIGGWIMTALWIAPCYGWLLLASGWARRSPWFVAFVPPAVLALAEIMLFGTGFVAGAVKHHLPGFVGGESQSDFYLSGAYWAGLDWSGLLLGLVFTAATVAGAVYLRRYRFDA